MMGKVIEVTEEQYAALERTAAQRGQTLEDLLDTLISEAAGERHVYADLDDFFRALGASEAEIAAATENAHQTDLRPSDDGRADAGRAAEESFDANV